MTLTNDSGGPNTARIIERSLRHRLEAHRQVNPERIDEILAYARENVKVRMTPRGWELPESAVQKVFDQIAATPRWQTATEYEGSTTDLPRRESAAEKLRRANREAESAPKWAPLRQDENGRYSTK